MVQGNPADKFFEYLDGDPDEACFFWTGGPVELAERTWFASQGAGVVAFETDDGLVLVDNGPAFFADELAARIRSVTEAPVHTAVYTHGHVDHAYCLDRYLAPGQDAPRVIGHVAMQERFARYEQTPRHNYFVNSRQFGGTVEHADLEDGNDASFDHFGVSPMPPDTYYEHELDIEVGGVRFELRHCRGETDDHTWVFCPDRGVLAPGDLFIWAVPNGGNPQKFQRYPWEWADGLRAMAAKAPVSMGSGHGGYVVDDADKLQRMLVGTADYVSSICDQALAALEENSPPHVDVVHAVDLPETDEPWLRALYDDPEFLIRSTVRYYGGWYSGRPSELKPARRDELAQAVVGLSGGAAALAEHAQSLMDANPRVACHLADFALEAEPGNEVVQAAVAAVYDRRADHEPGLMSTNLFRSAANYARAGRPFA